MSYSFRLNVIYLWGLWSCCKTHPQVLDFPQQQQLLSCFSPVRLSAFESCSAHVHTNTTTSQAAGACRTAASGPYGRSAPHLQAVREKHPQIRERAAAEGPFLCQGASYRCENSQNQVSTCWHQHDAHRQLQWWHLRTQQASGLHQGQVYLNLTWLLVFPRHSI